MNRKYLIYPLAITAIVGLATCVFKVEGIDPSNFPQDGGITDGEIILDKRSSNPDNPKLEDLAQTPELDLYSVDIDNPFLPDLSIIPSPDLSIISPPDLRIVAADLYLLPDLKPKEEPDLKVEPDFAVPPDLEIPIDLRVVPDLSQTPDLRPIPDLGKFCYSNKFDNPNTINDFTIQSGNWVIENGLLKQTNPADMVKTLYLKNANLAELIASVNIKVVQGTYPDYSKVNSGIIFRYGPNLGYLFYIGSGGGGTFDFRVLDYSTQTVILAKTPMGELTDWHTITLETKGTIVDFKLDGKVLGSIDSKSSSKGAVGLYTVVGGYLFDDLSFCEK